MPRILKLKEIDGAMWARVDVPPDAPIYVWSYEEAKQDRKTAIQDFVFDLVNRYIEERMPEL